MSVAGADGRTNPSYALGHSPRELERLAAQARLIDPITRRFFDGAGIGPGMRVLDVGSGAGHVALLTAELVGPSGIVVGTDLSADALAAARERAAGLPHVTFVEGDPARLAFDAPFDAVVGGYVLQFLADPVDMLRQLARLLRPGGLMVWHELDWDGARSSPPAPTYNRCCRWFVQSLRAAGHSTQMGARLHDAYVAAGFPEPTLRLESVVGAGTGASPCLALVGDLMPIMLPTMERQGIATAAEVGLDTLSARLRAEAVAGSVIFGRSEVGAWARKPDTKDVA